jgi:hypothetical protein
MNPVHNFTTYFCNIYSKIILLLTPKSWSVLFPSFFLIKILYALLISPTRDICILNGITLIMFADVYNLWW